MYKLFSLLAAALTLTACSSSEEPAIVPEPAQVTLTFMPYDVVPLKTTTSVADIVTHLDVWIVEGSNTLEFHQSATDANFGTLTATFDKTKTYTIYAVGHKADGATLTDGIISFTDDKVTHAMYYTTTFSPATTTSLSCLMNRIVADFRLEIADEIPANVAKMKFTITGVYDRWNVATGGTHQIDRVSMVAYNGSASIFNIYAIVTDAETTHTVAIEALDANDAVIQSRTFNDVPLRNGYKTTYRGPFFIDTDVSASFVCEDWSSYDTVNF